MIVVRRPLLSAEQQVKQSSSELATGRDEDEEVAGEVRQRQTVDDELDSPVVEVADPCDVSKHLLSVHTHDACIGRAVAPVG